jgi:ubiquinone/menaquinone biosynthesis C-methylase UbiE
MPVSIIFEVIAHRRLSWNIEGKAVTPDVLEILQDPITGEPLDLVDSGPGADGQLVIARVSGTRYPVTNGIVDFLAGAEMAGKNEKYRVMYDRISRLYDLPEKLLYAVCPGWFWTLKMEWMGEVEVSEGDTVLEVSIGTGLNLRFLQVPARYFGLDISMGMLKQCRRNLRAWNREAELFRGTAEQLPFTDEAFDAVYHVGGINFFNDKKAAIEEMVRVAKPGAGIMIVDENPVVVEKQYRRMPFVRKYFSKADVDVKPPVDLVPAHMLDVKLKDVWGSRSYCITLKKPG